MSAARYITFALVALCLALPARADVPDGALRARVERLRADRDVRVDGDNIAAPALIAAFYEQRDFQPAWTPAREKELVALVEASRADGLEPSDYHFDALRAGGENAADRELLYTDSLIRLAYSLYFGKLDPRRFDPQWNFARTLDGIDPPRALEAMIAAPSLGKALYAYAPQMPEYRALRSALARYRALRAAASRLRPRERWVAFLVRPETLLPWPRSLVAQHGTRRHRLHRRRKHPPGRLPDRPRLARRRPAPSCPHRLRPPGYG